MTRKERNTFVPPVVYPPGDTLREWIDERGISKKELAVRLGKLPKDVSRLLSGELSVTHDWADRLSIVTGLSSDFWRRKQDAYDAYKRFKKLVSFR